MARKKVEEEKSTKGLTEKEKVIDLAINEFI